jgi:uncharacterized Zn-binding protein involved in type VI secretion
MGKPAARITDFHACPMVTGLVPHVGGPVVLGAANVLTGSLPQARVGDTLVCVGPPDVVAMGSTGVFVNGRPAARLGDQTAHGGVIATGLFTVLIGETASGGGGGAAGAVGGAASGGGAGVAGAVAIAFTNAAQQAAVLVKAASSGAPFCEACFAAAQAKAKVGARTRSAG